MAAGHDNVFDRLMAEVGYSGKFQTVFSVVYVFLQSVFSSMAYTSLILALNAPEHWCYVPGRNQTNFTEAEWKQLTLPKHIDNKGDISTSSCRMYNANFSYISDIANVKQNFSELDTIECRYGYEYDKSWYDETIVSLENWVCNKDMNVANVYVAKRLAEGVGGFVFGQLGDIWGRRTVYYMSVLLTLGSRILSIVTTSSYILFILVVCVGGFSAAATFQTPLIIAMEIAEEEQRANIAVIQAVGYTLGSCSVSLLFWWIRDWQIFLLSTSLLTSFLFFFYKYFIESPRWLISRKQFGSAVKQFKMIGATNKREFRYTKEELRDLFSGEEKEKVYGMASLFSNFHLAKITILLSFSWAVGNISFYALVLLSSQVDGNPFLNLLSQTLAEFPGFMLGKYLSDKIGRRLTNFFAYFFSGLGFAAIIFIANYTEYHSTIVVISAIIRFFNGITYFAISLQAMEMFPTCVRNTGLSIGNIFGNILGVIAPYIVYLGSAYDLRLPYVVLCFLFAAGTVSCAYMPETLHQKLPDTLDDAKHFGKGQRLFKIPVRRQSITRIDENTKEHELETLN